MSREQRDHDLDLVLAKARVTCLKSRLQYQRAVHEDQALRQEHMSQHARNYRPPAQTHESLTHQRTTLNTQQRHLAGEKSRIFTQIKLIDQQIILVGALLNLANSTSSSRSTRITSGSDEDEEDLRNLLEERVELADQRQVMEHAIVRMEYNEALMEDTGRQIERFQKNLDKAESSVHQRPTTDRSKLSEQIEEIDVITKRLENIIVLIDRNIQGLETLTRQFTHSKTFDTQLLLDEKVILEDMKSKYIQHVNTYNRQKRDILYALSTLPL